MAYNQVAINSTFMCRKTDSLAKQFYTHNQWIFIIEVKIYFMYFSAHYVAVTPVLR